MAYDEHFKVCSFRQCYKCKRDVAARAYPFHLSQCKARTRAAAEGLTSKQHLGLRERERERERERPLAIPCCLVRT